MLDASGRVRPAYKALSDYLKTISFKQLQDRQHFVEKSLLSLGITFNVYNDNEGTERIFPVDVLPRIIANDEWQHIEKGLKQRITALNLFIQDIYNDQKILNDGVIPKELVLASKGFLQPCIGLKPPKGIWCHITGTDLIRDADGQYYVLEDNLRCPSGVAYVLENREIMKRAFSTLFQSLNVLPISDYSNRLFDVMRHVASNDKVQFGVLTPGIYNSAYFEHSFLARQMGVELLQPQDLVVKDGYLQMRMTSGFQKVDALYRRIDDDFLDPTVFNPDSMLGIPGLFEVYKKGRLALLNAPGTGVADDKVIYAFVPKMIRYYLGEDPILPNVETYICAIEKDCRYVLDNIEKLVVKCANEAGGYGMLVGPHATKAEHEAFRQKVKADPRNYIAQPTLNFSRCPSFVEGGIEGRHVDLRPYVLYGENIHVLPGGLTRVALRKGSLVVNSSQGGGSKDTWVLGDQPC
ncbi:MAG: circularly permuted type 2 ATP-grasp protein [Candidatus Margulisiibacteriota bacterium]